MAGRGRIWGVLAMLVIATSAACGTGSGPVTLTVYPAGGGLEICTGQVAGAELRSSSVGATALYGDDSVSVTGWKAVEPSGLEIAGVLLSPSSEFGGGAGLQGFPPDLLVEPSTDIVRVGVDQADIAPSPGPVDELNPPVDTSYVVTVGYHLSAGETVGTLSGIDLEYVDAAQRRGSVRLDAELTLLRESCPGL